MLEFYCGAAFFFLSIEYSIIKWKMDNHDIAVRDIEIEVKRSSSIVTL